MIESEHFPKSRVKAEFHSVHQAIEFVALEQDGKRITMDPEDCLLVLMKVLDKRKTGGVLPPPIRGLDARKDGCQG